MLFRDKYRNFLSYYFLFSFNNLAASTFAGESKFGSTSIDVTDTNTASIVKIGLNLWQEGVNPRWHFRGIDAEQIANAWAIDVGNIGKETK